MKRVSFEIAKTIKEAGYPQGETDRCFDSNAVLHYTSSNDNWLTNDIYIDAPTYLEVWLWLWRKKKVYFGIKVENWHLEGMCLNDYEDIPYSDPEKAIEKAIMYLVENDLIK